MRRTELALGVLAALLASGPGCSDGRDQAEAILAQSTEVTFNTVAQLGPHRLESTIVTEHEDTGVRSSESLEITWADWDNFQVRQIRDGELRREVRVVDSRTWVWEGGRFERREDPEIYRGVLAQTWNTWGLATGSFSEQIGYDYAGEVVVEGRRARRFTLRLATDEELLEEEKGGAGPKRRPARFVPMAISGELVIDEATSVHLSAELEARLVSRGGGRERVVRFREVRSGFGERPEIPVPTRAERRRR